MLTVKISAFSVQTALKHGTVYWTRDQYTKGVKLCQTTWFTSKTVKTGK